MRDMPLYGNMLYNSVNMSDKGMVGIEHLQESECSELAGDLENNLDLNFDVIYVKKS